ncbi:MAG TPA: hypothetical protein VNN62_03065 [Methylomirabilota bacterium]|nr:hypothetical protein [Methylomirabilota bacterium]
MSKKREKLIYDPLYRMKPTAGQSQASRRARATVWTTVVWILSFGLIRR